MDGNTRSEDLASDEECLLKDTGGPSENGTCHASGSSDGTSPPPVYKYRWLRVLPALFLYVLSGSPLMTVRSQYLYIKVQEYMNVSLNNSTTNSCVVNDSDPNYVLQQRVQAESANWNMYIELSHFMPSLIMTLFYGVYSDYLGRRITFILPPIGSMLTTLVTMAMLSFDLPIYFFFAEIVEYMFGGMYTMFMGAFSYIADTLPPEERSTPMTVLDALLLISISVAELFVGKWIAVGGFLPPLYFVMFGKIATLTYAIFFIPETVGKKKVIEKVPSNSESSSSKSPSSAKSPDKTAKTKFSFTEIKHGFLLYLQDNGTGRRWKLNVLLISYVFANIISTYHIMTLYEMNTPLCWDSVFIGYFGSTNMALRCIAMLLGAFILRKKFSEAWIAVMARAQSVVENLYLAFVKSTLMMFFVPVLGCATFMATPMTRAIMSKLVDKREQGSMFAVMTVAESFGSLISTLSVNKIYASTLFLMEGFIFLCGAVFGLMSLGCVLFFIWYSHREKKAAVVKNGPLSIQA